MDNIFYCTFTELLLLLPGLPFTPLKEPWSVCLAVTLEIKVPACCYSGIVTISHTHSHYQHG